MKTGTLSTLIRERHSTPGNLEQAQARANEVYKTTVQLLDDPAFPAWVILSLPRLIVPEHQTLESLFIWWTCFRVWMHGIEKFAPSLWMKLNNARIQWP